MKTAFCGPCFGAGDTPANNAFSIRHSTRNFPNREGSKLQSGQIASVALMDARSIAATAANKGFLTPATDMDVEYKGHVKTEKEIIELFYFKFMDIPLLSRISTAASRRWWCSQRSFPSCALCSVWRHRMPSSFPPAQVS